MIYQEPMASLNPAMRIGKQLIEVPMIHQGASEARPLNWPVRWLKMSACRTQTNSGCLSAPAVRRLAAAYRHCHGIDVETIFTDSG